jgi:hypothetical protein
MRKALKMKIEVINFSKTILQNKNLNKFLENFSEISIEQNPILVEWVRYGEHVYSVIVEDGGEIIGYSNFILKYKKLAIFYFGPLILNEDKIQQIFDLILDKLNAMGIWQIKFVGLPINNTIVQKLNYHYEVVLNNPKEFNWATRVIDLRNSIETIENGYSENLKRNIKKAATNGLRTLRVTSRDDVFKIANGYCDMYIEKGLKVNRDATIQQFIGIFELLDKLPECGYMYKIVSGLGKIVGGMIMLRQGDSIFYFRGYSNRDIKMPINHIGFSDAIKNAKDGGYKFFDFGGHSLNNDNTQLNGINRFKEGFGGDVRIFNPTIVVNLNKFGVRLIQFVKKFRILIKIWV